MPAIPAGQEDLEPTVRLPGKQQPETDTDRVEELEDSDATVSLTPLLAGVNIARRTEAQEESKAEKPPPEVLT